MKTKESLIRLLLEEVEQKAGRQMEMPKDFEHLWSLLPAESKLSMSTLKRLWGYVAGPQSTRESTLTILSCFAGYQDWKDFTRNHEHQPSKDESGFLDAAVLVEEMPTGGEVLLEWFPDHRCRVRKQDDGTLVVIEAEGCKLQVGDTFRTMQISVGNPFYATHVMREGRSLPDYVAGRTRGIVRVVISY